jgi:DNA mismatch endonuclease (patch repair protein)
MRGRSRKSVSETLTNSHGDGRRTMDMFASEVRSRIMAAVKGRGTGAEAKLRSLLAQFQIRFREQAAELPGCPDYVNDRLRVALFVDGDFWHGRWWRRGGRLPVANREYWVQKLRRNRQRDRTTDRLLRRHKWTVLRIWESDLTEKPKLVAARIRAALDRRRRQLLLRRGTQRVLR